VRTKWRGAKHQQAPVLMAMHTRQPGGRPSPGGPREEPMVAWGARPRHPSQPGQIGNQRGLVARGRRVGASAGTLDQGPNIRRPFVNAGTIALIPPKPYRLSRSKRLSKPQPIKVARTRVCHQSPASACAAANRWDHASQGRKAPVGQKGGTQPGSSAKVPRAHASLGRPFP